MISNEKKITTVGLSLATITINTPNCLGHPLIWPHKEELINALLSELSNSLSANYGENVELSIVSVEPGSIAVKLAVALTVLTIAQTTVTLGKEIYELAGLGDSIREQVESTISKNMEHCKNIQPLNISMQVFSKRGLCYGPVKQGDTLVSIANRLNPKGVTDNQVLMALYKYNPDAFYGDNINNLHSGAYLSLPKSPKYLSKIDADKYVNLHHEIWRDKQI
jgi:FimV-like protein